MLTGSSGDPSIAAAQAPPPGGSDPRGRIFWKYVILFVSVVASVLLVNGLIEVYFGYQENQLAIAGLQREKAEAAAVRIEHFVQEAEGQLWWATHPRGQISSASLTRLHADFQRLLQRVPALTELTFLDEHGRERLQVSRLTLDVVESGTDFSASPKFVEPAAKRRYVSPVYFRKDSIPYLTIALAGDDPEQGVTVAEVNLQLIVDAIAQLQVGREGVAYAVDRQGTLITHSDLTLVLKKTSLIDLPQVASALASIAGRTAQSRVAQNIRGSAVLTSHVTIPSLGWVVFVEQPLAVAFEPLYASIFRTLGLVVGGLGLSVVASLFLARRMVKPIEVLQAGAARIAAGDLEHRVEVKTGDEIELLGDGFNRMAASLEEAYSGLEQKVAERTRELMEVNQKLDEASRHKSQFLANMSHELRTPLNAILGYAELMLDNIYGELPIKIQEVLRRVDASGRHLLGLINDVLDLSKIEAGQLTLALEEYSFHDVIRTVLTAVEGLAAEKHLTLQSEAPSDLPRGRGDERRITQVLLNLVGNAIKFSEAGAVIIRAEARDGNLVVSVSDTGPGISEADRRRIFEEFQQVDSSSTRAKGGTGLGLSIAKRIIELHGGRIWVESAVGHGSTFWFTVPVRVEIQQKPR